MKRRLEDFAIVAIITALYLFAYVFLGVRSYGEEE